MCEKTQQVAQILACLVDYLRVFDPQIKGMDPYSWPISVYIKWIGWPVKRWKNTMEICMHVPQE